jgi:hypothetical protein
MAKNDPKVIGAFSLSDGATPDRGWGRVHPLSHADVVNLIDDGLKKYPLPDFTVKKYTGTIVPLQTKQWQAPSMNDPWGPQMGTAGDMEVELAMPNGLAQFPLRVSRLVGNKVTITDASGKAVFTHVITANPSTGGGWDPSTWDSLSVPLAAGRYTIRFHADGGRNGPFKFQTWKGVPITMTTFFAPKSFVPPLYFYVPKNERKVVFYLPGGLGQFAQIFDSQNRKVDTELRDDNKIVIASVPAGEDGRIWSVRQWLMSPNVPHEMLTTPQTFSLEPESLMVPDDALQ